jgi:peptide/nickel transport system ATP-binding protein
MTRRQARSRAIELLHETGLPEPGRRVDAYPHQLSGGQQQRAMIAMAIACEPRLLIADEPTTALDVTIQQQILDLIAALQRRLRMSVLFISHDLAVVGRIAQRVLVMRDGELREQGSTAEIFGSPRDAYTRALLACRPRLDSRPMRLPVLSDADVSRESGEDAQRSRGLRGDEAIVLESRGLSKSFHERQGLFGRREFQAVRDVSFRLARGRTLGVVGESGSGKTTLALLLMRLTPASGGEVWFAGGDWLSLPPQQALPHKRRMQIVFQNPYASLNPRFTVARILEEPLLIHEPEIGTAQRRWRALELLDQVGLPRSAMSRYPHEFSGGQRQRIAIARCLGLRPEVLICDESVSALDVSVQAQVLNLLQDLQDELGMSYLFISHDLAVVKYMADEIMVMKEGSVVELAASDDIHARPQHPYTRQLLGAIPEVQPDVR